MKDTPVGHTGSTFALGSLLSGTRVHSALSRDLDMLSSGTAGKFVVDLCKFIFFDKDVFKFPLNTGLKEAKYIKKNLRLHKM